jgi:uncharacterized protein (TIGR00251 family)
MRRRTAAPGSGTLPSASEVAVRVTTRASREHLAFREGSLRVYVTAAPVEGEANKAVTALVAKALKVPKSQVVIVRGEASRDKVLRVPLGREELESRLRGLPG